MSLFFNREEAIITARAMKIYIRSIEKRLADARTSGDEQAEALAKRKIRQCSKILSKASKFIEETSNLFLLVGDEFTG